MDADRYHLHYDEQGKPIYLSGQWQRLRTASETKWQKMIRRYHEALKQERRHRV